jgi:hypothetical protein
MARRLIHTLPVLMVYEPVIQLEATDEQAK